MKSVKDKIRNMIMRKEAGYVFTNKDFLRDFQRYEVDVALTMLVKEGIIRRIIQGIYERPRWNELLDEPVAPDIYSIASALARKFSWRIHPSGNTALNYLGLSTQIPGHIIYHSDGPSRKYKIGNRSLEFKHTSLHELVFRLQESTLVVQALKALGRGNVDGTVIHTLQTRYSPSIWAKIAADTCNTSGWIHEIIREISKQEEKHAENHQPQSTAKMVCI